MRLDRRHARFAAALITSVQGAVLGAFPGVAAAQAWLPLVRESRPHVVAEVFFEAESILEVDPGVFEIRLKYEPVAWSCVRRDRDGECIVYPDRLLTSHRITVIRIRCNDMSYEEVATWVRDPSGNWNPLRLSDFRHPPGWRYDIQYWTAVGAARDLVCATIPR